MIGKYVKNQVGSYNKLYQDMQLNLFCAQYPADWGGDPQFYFSELMYI